MLLHIWYVWSLTVPDKNPYGYKSYAAVVFYPHLLLTSFSTFNYELFALFAPSA